MHMIFALLIMSMSFFGCIPKGDPFEVYNDFKEEASQEAIESCLKENPHVTKDDCSLKNCFSSPITLLALHDLLLTADKALTSAGISYWVDSGTTIGAERFNAHLPWDDDVDLGVFAEDMSEDRLKQLTDILAKEGFEFKPLVGSTTMQDILGYQGLYQISYQKNRFIRLVMSYVPSINPYDLENLWIEFEARKSLLPHVDIFVYHEVSPGNYAYKAGFFAQGQWKGKVIKRSDLKGARTISLLGKDFPTVENFSVYGKAAYSTDDLLHNFVISREHSRGCKTLKLKDIREHKQLLEHMIRYLSFVYGSKPALDMGIRFDADAIRKRFGL